MTITNVKQVQWPVQNVVAFSTTRQHPFGLKTGKAPFQHFNLGLHVGDCQQNVASNRQSLHQLLPAGAKIQWLDQVHGSKVMYINQHSQQALVADALITKTRGLALAVMTADCLPIMLCALSGQEIAVIHGGWRGLAQGIIANTLGSMDTKASELYACLGPCIGGQAFVVGSEVRQIFIDTWPSLDLAFNAIGNNKFLADLQLIASVQLKQLGIKQVQALVDCTYSQENDYFSYRRDQQTGRMASLICRR